LGKAVAAVEADIAGQIFLTELVMVALVVAVVALGGALILVLTVTAGCMAAADQEILFMADLDKPVVAQFA
jgi:hypothetical protein